MPHRNPWWSSPLGLPVAWPCKSDTGWIKEWVPSKLSLGGWLIPMELGILMADWGSASGITARLYRGMELSILTRTWGLASEFLGMWTTLFSDPLQPSVCFSPSLSWIATAIHPRQRGDSKYFRKQRESCGERLRSISKVKIKDVVLLFFLSFITSCFLVLSVTACRVEMKYIWNICYTHAVEPYVLYTPHFDSEEFWGAQLHGPTELSLACPVTPNDVFPTYDWPFEEKSSPSRALEAQADPSKSAALPQP